MPCPHWLPRTTALPAHSLGTTLLLCGTLFPATQGLAQPREGSAGDGPLVLDRMVVTAAGFEQTVEDAPASITVLSQQELAKQSYTSVVDAVKNVPGVYLTGGGQSRDLSIRGMASTYTLYMVDGRPLSAGRSVNTNGQDSGKQIALPPLSMIERVEVIRGPMSSLYGSEAMGGVINFITRQPTEAWQGSLEAQYTWSDNEVSNDEQHTEMALAGPLVKGLLGLRLNGAWTAVDESDHQGGVKTEQSRPETRERQGGAELVLTPTPRDRLNLGYTWSTQQTTSTPGKSVAETPTGEPVRYRFDKKVQVLSHEGNYGALQLDTYLQHDVSEKVQAQTKEEKVTTLNTQGTWLWGDHVLTFGGRYRKEKYTNEENGLLGQGSTPDLAGAVRSTDRWIAAAFAEFDWQATDQLTVTLGLRHDEDERFGGHLSPRLYGVYHLTPNWTVKGGISTGYRQPTLTQATAGFGTRTGGPGSPNQDAAGNEIPRALIIGNPDLDPETSINHEAGLVFNDPDKGLEASLMVFQTNFKDKIAEDRYCTSPGAADNNDVAQYQCAFGGSQYYFLSTSKNIDRASMQGAELAATWSMTPTLRLTASYTHTESEQRSGEFKGDPLNKQPRHMANAMLDWQVTDRLGSWLQANYRGRASSYLRRTAMEDGTPGYGFVDAGLVLQITDHVDLKAGLYNIANKKVTNENYGVVLDGRRLTAGLSASF